MTIKKETQERKTDEAVLSIAMKRKSNQASTSEIQSQVQDEDGSEVKFKETKLTTPPKKP